MMASGVAPHDSQIVAALLRVEQYLERRELSKAAQLLAQLEGRIAGISEPELAVDYWLLLGNLAKLQGNAYDSFYVRALRIAQEHQEHLCAARVLSAWGEARRHEGDLDGAREKLTQAKQLFLGLPDLSPNNHHYATCLYRLARTLVGLTLIAEATEELRLVDEHVMAMLRELARPSTPSNGLVYAMALLQHLQEGQGNRLMSLTGTRAIMRRLLRSGSNVDRGQVAHVVKHGCRFEDGLDL